MTPAMPVAAPHAVRPSLVVRLRGALARHAARPGLQQADAAQGRSLNIGPGIPPIDDRHAPTWQDDLPFFLQQGYGRRDDR